MVRTQGAREKYSRPSAMMLPSDGLGGCTPRPRKLSAGLDDDAEGNARRGLNENGSSRCWEVSREPRML